MNQDTESKAEHFAFDTCAVRHGQVRTAEGEHSDPLFLTSSYVFANAAEAARRFAGEEDANVYSRYTNPTVRAFEKRLAALEGAQAGVAASSGMAAILCLCMALLRSGDHVLCSQGVFGATVSLFKKYLQRFGIEVSFAQPSDLEEWRTALRPQTRLLFLESPSNPLCEVCDISALAELAHGASALLVVDNCFCTPALQRPLSLGADLVVHSATKYLDGHGRCLGGAILGSREPIEEIRSFIRAAGPALSPFNAWVFYVGLETLSLRMARHCENALHLAHYLDRHPQVEQVFYAGLPTHPGYRLAAQQHPQGFGGVLSFRLGGGRERSWALIDALRLFSLTANLGDAKSTVVHPATTTHGRLSPEERAAAGITEDLVRIAVGLEDIADLERDLKQALALL